MRGADSALRERAERRLLYAWTGGGGSIPVADFDWFDYEPLAE